MKQDVVAFYVPVKDPALVEELYSLWVKFSRNGRSQTVTCQKIALPWAIANTPKKDNF